MNSDKRETIHHFDPIYAILKPFVRFWYRWYYRKVESIGLHPEKYSDPVILAPNHQNALMDALSVLFTYPGSIVFLARADIFKKPKQAKILHRLKIMPVFRIRDGAENLSKNDETFDAAFNVLKDDHPLCLMPEGNHGDKRRLRPLVKGIFRIAFQTQEELGDKKKVKIIPVGLDYEHYQHFRRNVFVNYGNPIEVSEYLPVYQENKAKGMNMLRDRLAEELKKLMIHIGSEKDYDVYQELRQYYTSRMILRDGRPLSSLKARFVCDKEMIARLDEFAEKDPAGMEKLASSVRELASIVTTNKLRYWLFQKQPFTTSSLIWRLILLVLTIPVFVTGALTSYLPFWFVGFFVQRKRLKDMQFFSSFVFGLGLIIFNVWYLLLAIPIFIFIPLWYVALLFFLALPLIGVLSYLTMLLARKTFGLFHFMAMKRRKDPVLIRAQALWDEILFTMDKTTLVTNK